METSQNKPGHLHEEAFKEKALHYAQLVDEEIIRLMSQGEQVPNLHDGALYAMGLDVEDRSIRGKRIRPVLCLMTAEMLGEESRQALAFACAIELLHNFALVHDDIEDGDTMRRGRDCTYVKYGLAHGINIGDYILSRVFSTISRDPHNSLAVREQLMDLLHRTMDHLFIGQSLDISARNSREFTLRDYERLVAMKTGSYLAAPILGGAIVAGADEDVITALSRFGNALGPLFQIKDDLIDLTEAKGREHSGNDIREGKRSYLVAAAAEKADEDTRSRLFDLLDKPRAETTLQDVEEVLLLFRNHGALDQAEAYCEKLQTRAIEALERLPENLRGMLETATGILASRKV